MGESTFLDRKYTSKLHTDNDSNVYGGRAHTGLCTFREDVVKADTSLKALGQAKCTYSEERHNEEKDLHKGCFPRRKGRDTA